MAEQKSIYELISENIIDGKLDEDFVLPDDSVGPVKFAAGAMDGMYFGEVGCRCSKGRL